MHSFKNILIAIITLGIFSCNSSSNKSRRPVSKITINSSIKNINYNSDFSILVESKTSKGKIDSVYVYLGSTLIKKTSENSFDIQIEKQKFIGNQNIKVIAKNSNGIEGTNYKTLFIASDILPKTLKFELVNKYKHDTKSFTQGLEFYNGHFYEGTGEYGTSSIYQFQNENGKLEQEYNLDKRYFGEGITILNKKLFQLTYKSQKGFVYDLNSFTKLQEFALPSAEGWGLTNDGKSLIMSDGTSYITYMNPDNFNVEKKIEVVSDKQSINNLNELEFVDGYIFANIWQTNYIIKIEASTGRVQGVANLSDLQAIAQSENKYIDVLNGIAYNKEQNSFYLTGKYWPILFKTKLKE